MLKGLDLSNEFVAVCEFIQFIENDKHSSAKIIIKVLVKETLKGELEEDVLKIHVGEYASENIKTRIDESELLLFFREVNNESLKYYFIDGCRIIKLDKSNSAILDRTKEVISINRIKSNRKRINKLIDWSIKCLKDETTKGNGLAELSQRGILYKYQDKTNSYKRIWHTRIKRKQKKELLNFFLQKEEFGYNEVFILALIEKGNKKLILAKMKEQLSLYDPAKHPWWKEFNLMKEISRISKNQELTEIIETIEAKGYYSRSEEIKDFTIKFIEKMRNE